MHQIILITGASGGFVAMTVKPRAQAGPPDGQRVSSRPRPGMEERT
jgi:hypothetical protein